ncbi:MAG: hypothetical protein VW644_04165 [Alphaproteobacteria bacterium]
MSADDFTRAGYRALVAALLERGYAAVGYDAVAPGERHLVLRHDLDMSIDAAVSIAGIEAELGVSAHYFVLLRTEMYNPWSDHARHQLDRIAALGHEIGLHFDASLYSDDIAALDRAAAEECTVLAALTGRPVETISFHRPSPALLGRPGTIAGRRHSYEPRYFHDIGYCSDSRGAWHHGHPLAHDAVADGRALQLLTHPIWWDRDNALDPVAALDRFRDARDTVLMNALADNCEPYRAARRASPDASTEPKNG